MAMTVDACTWASLLTLSIGLPLVLADANITILSIPVNITSWKVSLKEALNQSWSRHLGNIKDTLRGYVQFARNVSIGCAAEGEECIPDIPSCCPAIKVNDTELVCLPENGSYVCGVFNDSEEQAQRRLDNLEFGDSMGVMESHPWVNSWEFQSKSAMELEELQAAEEALWKKNWIPNTKENAWMQAFKRVKKGGKELWHDLRKIKKLRELKENLIDKYKARIAKTMKDKKDQDESPLMYPEEMSENLKTKERYEGKESEESIIKFSDEVPKREKKLDFRIDDIIKDAVNIVDKKLKKKSKAQKKQSKLTEKDKYYRMNIEEPSHLQEIEDTENKLKQEIEELKQLRKQKEQRHENELKADQNELDLYELIKRQVNAILDEERKLEKLRKIEELRRLEEGIKKNV